MNLLVDRIIIRQRKELAELFGFETRNKYEICDDNKNIIGFAAEQQKGLWGFLFRQLLGHWRSFDLNIFDANKNTLIICNHPFKFFFQEFHIKNHQNKVLGILDQRFAIFRKKFDVLDENKSLVFRMNSGFFQFWTFPITDLNGHEVAVIKKKWSGFLKEVFLDADNFMVEFKSPKLTQEQRMVILAASVFVDLQYFERKSD